MDEGFLINTECYDLSESVTTLIAVLSTLTAVSVATFAIAALTLYKLKEKKQ